jgi:hypothetical protein
LKTKLSMNSEIKTNIGTSNIPAYVKTPPPVNSTSGSNNIKLLTGNKHSGTFHTPPPEDTDNSTKHFRKMT